MREVNSIHIHHSGTDYAHHDYVAFIRKIHVKQNGWRDVGYNYFINQKGHLFICRPINQSPASIKGHNFGAIAICVSGASGINDDQKSTLIKLCRNLVSIFNIDEKNILRHKDLADTLCPNFDINFLKKAIYE